MDEEQAYDLVVGACPSLLLASSLDGFVASFEDEERPDRYVRISALAHHLVAEAEAGRLDEAAAVLQAAEQVLVDGDADAVELVRMGLLEYLQNICSHLDVGVGAVVFEPLLGPEGRRAWDEIDELWREAGRYAEARGKVTEAEYAAVVDPNLRRYLQSSKRRTDEGLLIAATDVVRYQTMVRDISPITPAGRPAVPGWAVAVALALCVVAVILIVT